MPWFRTVFALIFESPYTAEGGYLLSVVEGVAGNDKDILDVMVDTARYTGNDTGFAIIKSNKHHLEYSLMIIS